MNVRLDAQNGLRMWKQSSNVIQPAFLSRANRERVLSIVDYIHPNQFTSVSTVRHSIQPPKHGLQQRTTTGVNPPCADAKEWVPWMMTLKRKSMTASDLAIISNAAIRLTVTVLLPPPKQTAKRMIHQTIDEVKGRRNDPIIVEFRARDSCHFEAGWSTTPSPTEMQNYEKEICDRDLRFEFHSSDKLRKLRRPLAAALYVAGTDSNANDLPKTSWHRRELVVDSARDIAFISKHVTEADQKSDEYYSDGDLASVHDANATMATGTTFSSSRTDANSSAQPFSVKAMAVGVRDKLTRYFQAHILIHFLPHNYPTSVAIGYDRYSVAAFVAAVAGSAGMVLSTQTLLLAIGVVGKRSQDIEATHRGEEDEGGQGGIGGDDDDGAVIASSAPIMAGALNWVLKDGVGQLGGVWFASFIACRSARELDAHAKYWRMSAALALDLAAMLELLSPLAATHVSSSVVLPLACVANILKNIGFLTSSASRAALHQSLAIQGNLADVTAKAASQSMTAGMFGTALGIAVSMALKQDPSSFLVAFAGLATIHQGCNYFSLLHVGLTHFNQQRLYIVLQDLVQRSNFNRSPDTFHEGCIDILPPREVGRREVFFPLIRPNDLDSWLSMGSRLPQVCPQGHSQLEKLMAACSSEDSRYVIAYDPIGGSYTNVRIHLVFLDQAEENHLIMGMLHALMLRYRLQNAGKASDIVSSHSSTDQDLRVIASSSIDAKLHIPALLRAMEQSGWNINSKLTSIEPSDAFRLSILW